MINDDFEAELDPFSDNISFNDEQSSDDNDVIRADIVSSASVNQSTDSDSDDLNALLNASAIPVPEVTEESVTSHDDDLSTPTELPGDASAAPALKSVVTSLNMPADPQQLANHIAALFEAPVFADKMSIPYTSPKQWKYNYRIQASGVVIHLCQVEFNDDGLIIRFRLHDHMLTNHQASTRLMVIQAIVLSLNLGRFAYYNERLIFMSEGHYPVVDINLPQVEFNVINGRIDNIRSVDYE